MHKKCWPWSRLRKIFPLVGRFKRYLSWSWTSCSALLWAHRPRQFLTLCLAGTKRKDTERHFGVLAFCNANLLSLQSPSNFGSSKRLQTLLMLVSLYKIWWSNSNGTRWGRKSRAVYIETPVVNTAVKTKERLEAENVLRAAIPSLCHLQSKNHSLILLCIEHRWKGLHLPEKHFYSQAAVRRQLAMFCQLSTL